MTRPRRHPQPAHPHTGGAGWSGVPGRPWWAGERGSFAVELAVLAPLLMLVVFGGVQAATWFQARQACHAAAVIGAQAARVLNAPPGAGATAARRYAASLGDTLLEPQADQSDDAEMVTVTVTAQVPQILAVPGLSMSVTQSSTAPRERFVTP